MTDVISDGFHTFGELYAHRRALTAALVKALASDRSGPANLAWRSREHHEGGDPMFPGYFIIGIDLPTGTVTYHYKIEYWAEFDAARTLDRAPAWDGASADDSVARLLAWATDTVPPSDSAATLRA